MVEAYYYRRVDPEAAERIPCVMFPAAFGHAMARAFRDEFPFTVGPKDIERLRGMAATVVSDLNNPYRELADLIDKHGTLELTVRD